MAQKWKRNKEEALSAMNTGKSSTTSDYWKPAMIQGQEKTNYIVRILPNKGADDSIDWVLRNKHMITFPSGKYMSEPCPKVIGEKCPICETVGPLFNCGNPTEEKIAFDQYAKKRYFMNVYVIEDERDGGINEGKVFIWECPKKLMEDTILAALNDDGIMFSCPYEGANLKISIKKNGDFPDYGASRLMSQNVLGDDDEIEEIMEKAFDLNEKLLTPSLFKSYEDLVYMYNNDGEKPTGSGTKKTAKIEAPTKTVDEDEDFDLDDDEEEATPPPKKKKPAPAKKKPVVDDDDDEDFDLEEDDVEDTPPPKKKKPAPAKKKPVVDDDDDDDFDLDNDDFDLDDDDIDDLG